MVDLPREMCVCLFCVKQKNVDMGDKARPSFFLSFLCIFFIFFISCLFVFNWVILALAFLV